MADALEAGLRGGRDYVVTNAVTAQAGVDNVVRSLNAALNSVKGLSMRGIWKGALIIRRESALRVPVEHGNLRASAFITPMGTAIQQGYVEVGFSAEYAVHVHENLQQKWRGRPRKSGKGVYWGPRGEPKFLENTFDEKRDEVVAVAAAEARIP
jgi:hypothetical protein